MNQILDNPFPYSDTNKRYHTFSYAMKKQFGQKTAKIPLNAGFTCPNRDGSKATGGCLFCSFQGSGDTILSFESPLEEQFEKNLERARNKWPDALGIPYFQAYSNTYAPLERLQEIYLPFLENPDIPSVSIATRTDCFSEETAAWFGSFEKEVWIEFGIQSVHSHTAQAMNFQHSLEDAQKAIALCKKYGLRCCLHLINGLPGESASQMMETAMWTARQNPDAVKIHMLHLLENSVLGKQWKEAPFALLSQDEYVQIVCDQLEILPAEVIIERVTGDGLAEDLLEPQWTIRKTAVANAIDTELVRRNSWQGKYRFPFTEHPVLLLSSAEDSLQIQLTKGMPQEAMQIRSCVFLKEQGFTMEFDEKDDSSIHLLLSINGLPAGTLRLFEDDQQPQEWIIGRVVILPSYRHLHLGSLMLARAEQFIRSRNGKKISLHAQQQAMPFYAKQGYQTAGEPEYDEHVLHQWMSKDLS